MDKDQETFQTWNKVHLLYQEKFLDIDKVENEGKDIYGNFYAGQWGTFRVYFRFHQNTDGKFTRLDIGQSPK